MKTKATILVVALGALGFLSASAQSTNQLSSSTSSTLPKQNMKVVTPWHMPKETSNRFEIERAGNMSSRPWAEIAVDQEQKSDPQYRETPEPRFCLLSVGAQPKQ
jgi:hypothetical protein